MQSQFVPSLVVEAVPEGVKFRLGDTAVFYENFVRHPAPDVADAGFPVTVFFVKLFAPDSLLIRIFVKGFLQKK